jgi:hypothetical protein
MDNPAPLDNPAPHQNRWHRRPGRGRRHITGHARFRARNSPKTVDRGQNTSLLRHILTTLSGVRGLARKRVGGRRSATAHSGPTRHSGLCVPLSSCLRRANKLDIGPQEARVALPGLGGAVGTGDHGDECGARVVGCAPDSHSSAPAAGLGSDGGRLKYREILRNHEMYSIVLFQGGTRHAGR